MSYYISPRFLDKLAIHITKNYLELPGVKVPLILGVHGRKGEGKSFQCELAFQQMGVGVVHMSAGELESPDAGDPARLVRLRYREAAELCKVRGKMAVLMINDIDAGAGRVDQFTQYTVNTQLVSGTLMNIADNPTNVQLPGSYEIEPIQRIPIIVTGNDFSTLYAPLIRDGRMEKFFWEPDRDDRIGIVQGIFSQDRISRADVATLVDTFSEQSIDFYSALHSRLYDEQVRRLIQEVGIERISLRVVNSAEKPPEFHQPDFHLEHLIELGKLMVREQQRIQELRLIHEYNNPRHQRLGEASQIPPRPPSAAESTSPNPISNGNSSTYSSHDARSHTADNSQANGQTKRVALDQEALETLRGLLGQGYRVGIEYVDERRFRTNSWQGYAAVQGSEAEAIGTLESCLRDHSSDYIRLVGINPGDRRRVSETIIQRPHAKARP
jgi:ribulose bisphosphate carboxylase small subunit